VSDVRHQLGARALGVSLGLLVASGALAADNPPPAVRPHGRRAAADSPTALSRGATTIESPAPTPALTAAAPAPEPTASTTRGSDFNSCKKVPAGKRVVRLKLKPETNLGDLVAWISSVTCKAFLLPGTIPSESKKVTIIAPGVMTPEEAYGLFLDALESVGLTVEPSGWFSRIIETSKARSAAVPFVGDPTAR
jgi:general secretion pathway protein D